MAAEPDQDRNEAATPYKLARAHEKGQLARSTEVISAIVFLAAVAYLLADGAEFLVRLFALTGQLMGRAGNFRSGDVAGLWQLVDGSARHGLALLVPFFLTLMISAVLSNLAQTRGLFRLQSVLPDGARLQFLSGLKRAVSSRTLFDVARALAKLVLLTTVMVLTAGSILPQFQQAGHLTPAALVQWLLEDVASIAGRTGFAMLLIAIVDLAYVHREFGRNMRMSRREVRDEARQREGDPRVRGRLRELRRELLKRSRAVQRTRHADLVVTNPTHFAVALRYQHGRMDAPQVLAKGAGVMAWAMRNVAHRHRVPVVARPALARALYAQVVVDESLPEVFYRDVAQLLIWVLSMRQPSRSSDGAYV